MKDRFVQPASKKVCYGMLSSPKSIVGASLSFSPPFFQCKSKADEDKGTAGVIRVGDPVTVLEAYPKPKEGPYLRSEDLIGEE
jgi:hypothetical protein